MCVRRWLVCFSSHGSLPRFSLGLSSTWTRSFLPRMEWNGLMEWMESERPTVDLGFFVWSPGVLQAVPCVLRSRLNWRFAKYLQLFWNTLMISPSNSSIVSLPINQWRNHFCICNFSRFFCAYRWFSLLRLLLSGWLSFDPSRYRAQVLRPSLSSVIRISDIFNRSFIRRRLMVLLIAPLRKAELHLSWICPCAWI